MADVDAQRTSQYPTRLEIIAALLPGLVRVVLNPYLAELRYVALCLFIALLMASTLECLRRLKKQRHTPWFWPPWVLVFQCMWYMIVSGSIGFGSIIYGQGWEAIGILSLAVAIGVWCIWRITKQAIRQRSVWLWIALVLLAFVTLAMTFYTGTDRFLGDCFGIYYRISNLSCLIREQSGMFGYTWFSMVVLLIPLSFALRSSASHGISVVVGVSASTVLWRDVLFLPFHPYGGPWLDAARSSACLECSSVVGIGQLLSYLIAGGEYGDSACTACDILPFAVSTITYLLIIGMMILVPVSLLLLRTEKARRLGVAIVSIATLTAVYLTGIRTLILAQQILPIVPLDVVMLILWVLELGLPIACVVVATTAKHPPQDEPKTREHWNSQGAKNAKA